MKRSASHSRGEAGPLRALLVLPPFAGADRPSLGLHVLQACSRAEGVEVHVRYANLAFAAAIGDELYEDICYAPTEDLLGERVFAFAAFGSKQMTAAGREAAFRTSHMRDPLQARGIDLQSLQQKAAAWVRELAKAIVAERFDIVGCNSTFEQTSASVALLSAVREIDPTVITLLGGANCEGEMATGIAELSESIDYIFSGESEATFPEFLSSIAHGLRPSERVIYGKPCANLDSLPTVDYSEYYRQLEILSDDGTIRRTGSIWLPYESSRGCWWGQKHHCTFCGINGEGMTFRQKSPATVLRELPSLLERHPTNKVLMVDNIMPSQYFTSLLPELCKRKFGAHIFYEQKANLTLQRVELLKEAGVAVIQPGIEALSTPLLQLMKKGVSASQNIALLRFARSVDLAVNWNLLYAFPGDAEEDYLDTMRLIPLISHLTPPSGACHLSIDRFSPYFDRPKEFGVSNIRPMDAYASIFPSTCDVSKIAYHFVGDYECADRKNPELRQQLEQLVADWRVKWTDREESPPMLAIEEVAQGIYILIDTRLLDCQHMRVSFISEDQAKFALTPSNMHTASDELRFWAIETSKVAVILDGKVTPLATARPSLLKRFAEDRKAEPLAIKRHPVGESALASADSN